MGKRKHRRSKTTPGYIDGHRGNSFDSSVIDESPIKHEEEEEEKLELDPQIILKIPNPSQSGVNPVNFTQEGDDYQIFNPPISTPLPVSFSQSSSSRNSSISLKLPSSNASSSSHSSADKSSSRSGNGETDHNSVSEDDEQQLTFPVSDFSQIQQGTLIQYPPPVQAMDRLGEGYDPHRIPASIFETNRTADWSVASNESLFSLHLGRTSSFSREQLDFRISDVEFDHVLKKIEEDDSDQERIIEGTDEEEKSEIRLNQIRDDLKLVIGEASLRHGDLNIPSVAKGSKYSEDSIQSSTSFAFDQVLTKPKHSSSIRIQQHESEPGPAVEKARSKSWFCCCSFSSYFLGSSSCSYCSCSSCLPSRGKLGFING